MSVTLKRRHALVALLAPMACAQAQTATPSFDASLPIKAAEGAVRIMAKINGETLDYSEQSLHEVDRFVLSIRGDGTDGAKYERLLNVLGFYVGEVLARRYGLKWDKPTDLEAQHGAPAYSLRHATGRLVNPIGKVFKLFKNGEEDKTHALYVLLPTIMNEPSR